MRIKTITTAYNQDEDRLRFAIVDEEGHHRVLWLTRRLAERLVPALLQGMVAPAAEDAAPPEAPAGTSPADAAQVYAQLEARLAQKPLPPIEPGPDAPQGVVYEITLKAADQGLRGMEFHCRSMSPCELFLTPRELRQWLQLVHTCFRMGQWREDIWPAWILHG